MPVTIILSLALVAGCFFAAAAAADAPRVAGELSTRVSKNTAGQASSATQWPQWRGAERTGMSPDTGLLHDWSKGKPKLLWTAEGIGVGFASVSLADGRIYTTGNQADGQAATCLNADDGKVIWTGRMIDFVPKHDKDGSRSTPSIDGDRLYAITSSGKLACLSTTDGREVWSKD